MPNVTPAGMRGVHNNGALYPVARFPTGCVVGATAGNTAHFVRNCGHFFLTFAPHTGIITLVCPAPTPAQAQHVVRSGWLAQSVEQLTLNQLAQGSSP